MSKKYMKVYLDLLDALEPFGDAERGRLFTAMLEYSRSGVAPELGGNERFLFPMIRAQIDRDNENYEEKCTKNAENGRLGGRPKKQTVSKKPNAFLKSEKSQDKEEDKEKDKEKDKDYTPHNPPKGGKGDESSGGFALFWSAYPKKVAKEAARKAFEKLKPDEAMLGRMLSALETQKAGSDWQKDGGQYIPYPATWLNGRRWEDDLAQPSTPRALTDNPFLQMLTEVNE